MVDTSSLLQDIRVVKQWFLQKQIGAHMTVETERLESVEEASRRLAVSSFTLRRLIKAKQLRAVRVSKRVLVPESEIARVIAQGCGKHAGHV